MLKSAEYLWNVLLTNNVFHEYKGGMTEQYVLSEMKCVGAGPVYYFKSDQSRLEIDFIVQSRGGILPIEVKAEGNVRAAWR